MSKLVIGLDLGIASVGYSVVLNKGDGEIALLERGSHLFPMLSNPKTVNTPGGYGEGLRGEQRRARRTIRRRKQRRIDFIRLINDYIINNKKITGKYSNIFNFKADEVKKLSYPIYELSVKGLEQELDPQELFKVLYSKLSFRGVSYSLPNENLEKPLAVELLEFLNLNKKVRTTEARINQNNETLKFSLARNKKDIEKIIDNCSYLKNTQFKEEYLTIFGRVRDYAKGAGSEKSRTNGGIYKNEKDENGNFIQLKSMWEESIGKCPVFKDKFRSLKCQALPEIANLLSQLNSIKYKLNDEILVLTEEQKKKIVIEVMVNFQIPTPTKINKIIGIEKGLLYGYPTSKDKTKHNIEKCENLIRLFKNKVLIFKDWQTTLKEIEFTDQIFSKILINYYNKDEIINANKNYLESIELVKEADKNKIINNYNSFCCLNPVASQGKSEDKILESLENYSKNNISGTHAFSLEAIKYYILKNIDTQKSLSTFYRKEINLFQISEYSFSKYSKYINNRLMDGVEFISPNVKNAMSETCKIFNKILKKYIYNGPKYFLDALVIETTSDSKYALNGMENNKKIIKLQTQNENEKTNIKKEFPNIKESAIEKIILLKEQDYIDLYDGKPIHAEDVIRNPNSFEIDHILPMSRTQLNDRSNKVLTKTSNNQMKGKKTPVEWLSGKANFIKLKDRWKEILKSNPTKLKYMLLENLDSKREKSFIARNLTETQYIMRRIKNGFLAWKNFVIENHSLQDVKNRIGNLDILTVSGSVTQRLRSPNYLNLDKKDRNLSAEHHSIDASICAILGTIDEFRYTFNTFRREIDNETGEIKWVNDLKPKDIFSYFVVSQEKWINFHEVITNSFWILSYKYMTKFDQYKNKNLSIEDKLKVINNNLDELDESKKVKSPKQWQIPKLSGETIYGWVEKENIKYQKERMDLYELKDSEIEKLNEIFSTKTYEDSNCLNPKNYFIALQKIWIKYYINKKENPFLLYMNEHKESDKEFQKALQLKHIKLIDGKLNSSISRMTFIGNKTTVGLDLTHKVSKNAYMSQTSIKCIFVIKDHKQKIRFLKEDWINSGQKECAKQNWEIIDIIEKNTIYKIDSELLRVSTFGVKNNTIKLQPIQVKIENEKKELPYSTFIKKNPIILNKITIQNPKT